MSRHANIKVNVIANFIGSFGVAILSFIFIPIYINYLGIEAYGIIGFYTAVLGFIQILDFGMSGTLNRSISKIRIDKNTQNTSLNLLKSFEVINILIALIICFTFLLLHEYFAFNWFNVITLDRTQLSHSLILIGLTIAFRWPTSIYIAAFKGLEKQVLINSLQLLYALASAIGVILLLKYYDNSIATYFQWHLFCTIIYLVILKVFLLYELKSFNVKGRFDLNALKKVKSFLTALGFITFFTAVYTHLDKIFISKLVSLEDFGYYSIGASIAAILYKLIYPVAGAVYPRIIQHIHREEELDIIKMFHKTNQMISLLVIPAGLTLIIFAEDLIWLWSRDLQLSKNVAPITRLLSLGTMMAGLTSTSNNYQLGYGYTKILFYQNLLSSILLVPLLYLMIYYIGIQGAALVWVIINSLNLTIAQYFFFARFLTGEARNWIYKDIFRPLIVCAFILGLTKIVSISIENNILIYILIFSGTSISILSAVMIMDHTKDLFFKSLKNLS